MVKTVVDIPANLNTKVLVFQAHNGLSTKAIAINAIIDDYFKLKEEMST